MYQLKAEVHAEHWSCISYHGYWVSQTDIFSLKIVHNFPCLIMCVNFDQFCGEITINCACKLMSSGVLIKIELMFMRANFK